MDVDKLEDPKKDEEKADKEPQEGNWLALESNPDVLNKFAARMGMLKGHNFTDIWGFDDDMLAFVPKPVVACVFLFPSCKEIADYKKKQKEELEKKPQKVSKNLFYVRQHDKIGNACGTIALLHALTNASAPSPAKGPVKLDDKGPIAQFMKRNLDKTPDER